MKNINYCLKIVYVYVGAILGAGFASGREILSFFGQYGSFGIFGLFLSCVILTLFGVSIFNLVIDNREISYDLFVSKIFTSNFGTVITILMNLFLFISFTAMIAGMGEAINTITGISTKIGSIIFSAFLFMCFLSGATGLLKINNVICPLMILLGLFVGIHLCLENHAVSAMNMTGENRKWVFSSILYASYNVFALIPIIFGIRNEIKTPKLATYSGIVSGVIIFLLAFFILIPVLREYSLIESEAMPIMILISKETIIKHMYTIVLVCAIFTTALGNGFGLIESISNYVRIKRVSLQIIICISGFLCSLFGFSNIVDKVYRLMGYLGLLSMFWIIIHFFYNTILRKNKI